MDNIFFDIGMIIIFATALGYLLRIIRQPAIPGYILAGLVIGPFGLQLINDTEEVKLLGEIGIAFLLFIVGIDLNFGRLRDIGQVSSLGTTIQVSLLFVMGLIVAKMFSAFTFLEGIYIGLILAFSSTMIVIKILSDKKELDTLHGRIIIGILLMQDILAILALSILNSLGQSSLSAVLFSIVRGFIILLVAVVSGRYIFDPIFKLGAKSTEILFLLSVSVCFIFSFLGHLLGLSVAIGAFLAGVTIANLPYNLEIASRVKPLRDFFSTLFFVALGMQLSISSLKPIIVPLVILTLFVLAIKPFIIMVICMLFGYAKRTSFLTSISLAQISEFSLIIVTQGLLLGHVSSKIFSLCAVLAIITIIFTSYFIKYDYWLYSVLNRYMEPLGLVTSRDSHLEYIPAKHNYEVILIGYDRIGYSIIKRLGHLKEKMLVVDYNPDLIRRMIKEKIPCIYGDIGDAEILDRLNFEEAKIIISTVPEEQTNLLLIRLVKHKNSKSALFVTANQVEEALRLYESGADYVILPHFLGGHHVGILLENVTKDMDTLLNTKIQHIEELKVRKSLGHEHPKHHHKDL
ncbi:MAG: cation:proton antiporter [archaeon]